MLHAGADRVDGQAPDGGDGYGVVALVEAQEADPEFDTADRLVDVVREAGVEDGGEVAAHQGGSGRGDRDMAHAGVTGDPAGGKHLQGLRRLHGAGADLLGDALGAGEAQEAFDAALLRLLGGALGAGDAMGADSGLDLFERGVVVEVPAGGDDVLGRAAPQQEPALLVVQAEARQAGVEVVVVHADGVGAEAAPVREAVRLDDDVTQTHGTEDGGVAERLVEGVHRRPARKSAQIRLNSSARSNWTQCPVLATS